MVLKKEQPLILQSFLNFVFFDLVKMLTCGGFPLTYWNRAGPQQDRDGRLVTVRFRLASVFHRRRVGTVKAGLFERDSDVKPKIRYLLVTWHTSFFTMCSCYIYFFTVQ